MAVINNVAFQSIEELSNIIVTEFDVNYPAMINAAEQIATPVTKVFTTNTEAARIPFIDNFPVLDQIGLYANANYETPVGKYLTEYVQRWVQGVSIGRFVWTDSASQQLLLNRINTLMSMAAWQRSRQVARSLNLGETSAYPAYDGQNLFSANHSINGVTWSNLLANNPLDPDGFRDALYQLQTVPLGEDGTYLPTESAKFYLFCNPFLEPAARLVLRSTTIYESNKFADNPYINMAELRVSSLLTDPNDWFLLAVYPGVTPYITIQQVDGAAKMIPRISDTDVNVIDRNEFLWNIQMVENTVPVHFYQMVKSTNS